MFGLNDPFGFNNINSIMNGFMVDPFAPPHIQQQQLQQQQQRMTGNNSANNNQRSNNQMALRQNPFDPFGMMASPFDRHHSMMAHHNNPFNLMNQMMSNMNNMHGTLRAGDGGIFNADPNSAVYSSSSVISYTNGSDGKPKIYQESMQTRQGPGGVKETRQMLRDSEKGIEKVSVGHHIGERAHVIERQKFKGGNIEEIVNLENLDDEEVPEFNKEFEEKLTSQIRSSHHHSHNKSHHLNNNQPFAIEDGHSHRKNLRDKERKSKSKSKH